MHVIVWARAAWAERDARLLLRWEGVKLMFSLSKGSAGLLEHKRRYRLCSDDMCVSWSL